MTRFALLALPLLLAACGTTAPRAPEDAAAAECRAETRNDPRLAALGRTSLPGNRANDARIAEERRALQADLVAACLRARSAGTTDGPRGGGVEAVRRR